MIQQRQPFIVLEEAFYSLAKENTYKSSFIAINAINPQVVAETLDSKFKEFFHLGNTSTNEPNESYSISNTEELLANPKPINDFIQLIPFDFIEEIFKGNGNESLSLLGIIKNPAFYQTLLIRKSS